MKRIDYLIKTFAHAGPRVYLCVGFHSKETKTGPPLLTAECVSEREIDANADQIIREVNDARNRAKRAFRRALKQ